MTSKFRNNKNSYNNKRVKSNNCQSKQNIQNSHQKKIGKRIKFWTDHIMMIKTINDSLSIDLSPGLYKIYQNHVANMIRNNGEVTTITYLKEARNILYKYVSQDSNIYRSSVKITKDKIPVFLQDFIPLIRQQNKDAIRASLSLLNLGKLIKGVGILDTSTITQINNPDTINVISDETIYEFVQKFDLEFDLKTYENIKIPISIRTSNGPFGPGMTSVIEEAKLLSEDDINVLKDLGSKFNIQDAQSIINHIYELRKVETPQEYSLNFTKDRSHLRKITVVEDKENKNRVIAIFDY